MSNSIQKRSLEDNIRFFYFRYRGNVSRILEGLRKLPGYRNCSIDPGYIEKVIKKFQKQRKRDWGINTCYNFMEYLHMGAQERLARCQQWLDELEGASEIEVSVCHKSFVGQRRSDAGEVEYICLDPRCGNICEIMTLQEPGIYELRMKILDEMRKDEELLLKALKDLGFSASTPEEVKRITNYNLIATVKEPPQAKHVSSKELEILDDTRDFTPVMREKLIKDVERLLEDGEDEKD